MRRRLWLLVGFVVAVAAVAAYVWLVPASESGKTFTVPALLVDATLRPDGSMRVTEHITYDFSGSFTYGTRRIPPGDSYRITDLSVSEGGRELATTGAPYDLRWELDARDERRTVVISYTVESAVRAGPDIAELEWNWIGTDHPGIGRFAATLGVPPGPGELRAWGHGRDGRVRIRGDVVSWRAPRVPPGELVAGRVAMATARVPGVAPTATPRLPTILREERALSAGDRRDPTDRAQRRDQLDSLVPFAVVLGMLTVGIVWWRWGRPPPLSEPVGRYYRDLPDDPPAVVVALMHWGNVRASAFGATVMDLAQRRYFTIQPVLTEPGVGPRRALSRRNLRRGRGDYELTLAEHLRPWFVAGAAEPRVPAAPDREVPIEDAGEHDADDYDEDFADDLVGAVPAGALRGFERMTLEQLFSSGGVVRQSELARRWRSHRRASRARWRRFATSVERSLRARGYLAEYRALPYAINTGMAVAIGLFGLGLLSLGGWIGGAIAIAWAIVQGSLTRLLRQRTPSGELRYQQWRGVRSFLHDFSQLESAPAGHLVLWERYLVYAVALGVSTQLARGLAAHLPAARAAEFAGWAGGGGGDIGDPGFGSLGDFAAGMDADAVGSFSPASVSGMGGAFTGGDGGGEGGGGGGGGIGAG